MDIKIVSSVCCGLAPAWMLMAYDGFLVISRSEGKVIGSFAEATKTQNGWIFIEMVFMISNFCLFLYFGIVSLMFRTYTGILLRDFII